MKTSNALARILAWHKGHPLPDGSVLPLRRVPGQNRLLVAFLSMGGETSTWGVIWGYPGATPQLATTPDPRDRDAVCCMLRPFATDLLAHLPHPTQLDADVTEKVAAQASQRQLWVPGGAHLQMLHLIQYRLSSSRENEEGDELLQALGRACGWLFRESCRPGQQRVIDASALLREIYTFPADDGHQAHLGFELAWLTTPGDRTARIAAAALAEKSSIGTTLHPAFERKHIEPALDDYARLDEGAPDARLLAATITKHLEEELLRRWHLLEQASALVDADPRPSNPTLGDLDPHAAYLFGRFWDEECARLRGEEVFEVHAETDGQLGAAYGYLSHQRGQDDLLQVVLHGDAQRLEEAILEGDAVRGVLTEVVRTGKRNSRRTRWTLETSTDAPLRLRQGGTVCPVGVPKMKVIVRSIQQHAGRRQVELEVTAQYDSGLGVGFPAADDDDALVGREVSLVPSAMGQILIGKAKRLSNKEKPGPGAWLTVAEPVPPSARPRSLSEDVLAIIEGLRG